MRLIALLLAASALSAQAPRKAPSFTLPDVNRKLYDLTDYRGKVVVLEIMSTTCPHCAAFSKVLEQVHKQYAGRVQVLSIVNPPDGPGCKGVHRSGFRSELAFAVAIHAAGGAIHKSGWRAAQAQCGQQRLGAWIGRPFTWRRGQMHHAGCNTSQAA